MLAQSNASSLSPMVIGLMVLAGVLLIQGLGAFLAVFITRREVDTLKTDFGERLTKLEAKVDAEAGCNRTRETALRNDIHAAEKSVSAAGEERAVKIHERLNLITERLGYLTGEFHAPYNTAPKR